jgi:NAD(P)-dependent dehydrogenase (short-subunit alcohol dehydrogenase family)
MATYPDMSGRVALVTGTSGGIGLAIRDALLEHDVHVIGLDVAAAPPAPTGARFDALECDLRSPPAIVQAIAQVRSETSRLDYLVNDAGWDPHASIEQTDEKLWDSVLDLNLRAYHLVVRESLDLLRRGAGRAVVNIASIHYRLGHAQRSAYAASKAGILGLTRCQARELGKDGIRVNAISPGWVFTDRQVAQHFTDPADRERNLASLVRLQAIDRHISPRDIANHVLFYLSEASAASTGHNCVVDGGWTMD